MDGRPRALADLRLADADAVGGKAAGLGELIHEGARVPDGVVLPPAIATLPDDARRAAAAAAASGLGPGRYAIRSSAIGEDGSSRSHAGLYDSVLDVAADGVPAAVERCLESASSSRVAAYGAATDSRMGVVVQRMVPAVTAGVAFTADPATGDRDTCLVNAVRGLGSRLVGGEAIGDEWIVRGRIARSRRLPEQAIDARGARRIADEARRIAERRGCPQDVEWAIDADGELWLLQARPMTALPPDVAWDPPARGAYTRAIRLGEWIGQPVTPLFASWLLPTLEERIHRRLREWIGQWAPRPYHVVVHGWYFYSINFLSPSALLRTLPALLWRLVRTPRRVAGLVPAMVRHSVPLFEREWREVDLPQYRAAVARAEALVDSATPGELVAMVDDLAVHAGDYFASIAALAGSAYKREISLARFHRRHLAAAVGGSHLPLVSGINPPANPGQHAVTSLDWWYPPVDAPALAPDTERHGRLVATRRRAEDAAIEALAHTPRRLSAFRRLLADAQYLAAVREEQVRDLTIGWPVMRRAVARLGEALARDGGLQRADDVFFLAREELLAGMRGDAVPDASEIARRCRARDDASRLVPPLIIGRVDPLLRRAWEAAPGVVGARPSERALVCGTPAAPGRATGVVRVVRDPDDCDSLAAGEVLVAPLTAPAWTPLFARAAAVVTDVGSVAAHASIIAREYGIPAVVGCGDATARLRTGMRVVVDGSTGNVEAA